MNSYKNMIAANSSVPEFSRFCYCEETKGVSRINGLATSANDLNEGAKAAPPLPLGSCGARTLFMAEMLLLARERCMRTAHIATRRSIVAVGADSVIEP